MDDIKLQKYVSDCGLMSRRAAEKEIESGCFEINGVTAVIGARVKPESDAVTYKGKPVVPDGSKKVYIMLNKPKGVVTTMSDEKGRKTVADVLGADIRIYPVGRLDLNSEGLLLMTNDGDLANAVAHPSGMVKKVYSVILRGKVENGDLDRLRAIKEIDGEKIVPAEIILVSRSETSSHLKFVLSEGKNREIRRLCETVGLYITSLKRVALGPLQLGDMKTGEFRPLTKNELDALKKAAGMKTKGE